MTCTCPIDEQCTCGAGVPEYGELPAPRPMVWPVPITEAEQGDW